MPHQVGNSGQFAVGRVSVFVVVNQSHDHIVSIREQLPGQVLLLPQLHLIVRVHFLGFLVEVGLRNREFPSQPDLVDDLRNDLRACLLSDWSKIISIVEDETLLEWNLPVVQFIDSFRDGLAIEASSSCLKLFHVYFIPSGRADEDAVLDEDGFGRDVPDGGILFVDVAPLVEVNGTADELQQSHEEDHAVREVDAVHVMQLELRDVPETLYGKDPHMVEDALHQRNIRVLDSRS